MIRKLHSTKRAIARLKEKNRALENGQKIILGGLLLNAARHQPLIRKWLLDEAAKVVTRDVDKKRLAPLLHELAKMPES